eukprot:362822-Chlamydomonas_euryale.AAC.3
MPLSDTTRQCTPAPPMDGKPSNCPRPLLLISLNTAALTRRAHPASRQSTTRISLPFSLCGQWPRSSGRACG